MRDILVWAAAVEAAGLATLPLLRSSFGNRRDAALLSRPVGLALVGYGGWALALLVTGRFDRATLLLALVALALVSFLLQRRAPREERSSFWGPEEKRAALLFWAPTAIFLLLRAASPEILGQEKFMDLAFLNSLTRNRAMPPPDPWMAGKTINYYYWGYLLAAGLTKLSGVPTMVSYNLAIATFAGYSFVAAACLALRLSGGRRAAGVWAGVATVFAGNLTGAFDAWKAPLGKGFDYWHASRVIGSGNTINEFPFFTFLHADLHPHLLAFPFFIAAFAVAHRYVELGPSPASSPAKPGRLAFALGPAVLLALIAGTARAANNWNLPALALLLLFACVFRSTTGRRLPTAVQTLRGAVFGTGVIILSLLLWLPYSRSYALQTQGLAVTTMKSDLLEFLGVWGILFFAGLAAILSRSAMEEEPARRRRDLVAAGVAAASLVIGLAERAPALVALIPMAALAAGAAWRVLRRPEGDPDGLFSGFLLLLAVAMIGGCEFIYFRDSYGGDLQRMNTIFKFYHQAWPLLAVPVAVFAERVWSRHPERHALARRTALVAAAALMLLYPIDAALWRLSLVQGGFSLDARNALLRRNPGDAAAIGWLEKNAPRGSVILEATGDPYSEYARISSHTGIPTVLGWANHEGLWRANDREIGERAGQVRAFYGGGDARAALSILQKYGVTHVVVGDLERRTYPLADNAATLPYLDPVLPGSTTVYRIFGAR